ncbi:hypothetical protein ACX0G7_27280, partial [Flavitalea antarctica]
SAWQIDYCHTKRHLLYSIRAWQKRAPSVMWNKTSSNARLANTSTLAVIFRPTMPDQNKSLEFLYDILIDNFETFENELKLLISRPGDIENTNRFTWLISKFINKSGFIEPFLSTIAVSDDGDKWLSDYLFAAVELINNASSDDVFEIPEGLIEKLKWWILRHKGELSWKSATLLKYFEAEIAEEIQLKKLQERDDFFLTYVECMLGLVRHNKDKHLGFVKEIADDITRDERLREFAKTTYEKYR